MIEYRNEHNAYNTDAFSESLREASEYFKLEHDTNVIGDGFKDVLTESALFESYADRLTEGLDATEEAQVRQLLENSRRTILSESVTAGIPGLTSLTMPAIRKMWAKVALKYAIPTETVKTPTFSVAFNRPFIEDKALGKKEYLPEALRNSRNGLAEKRRIPADFFALPLVAKDLLAEAGVSASTGDSLDRQFFISGVKLEALDASGLNAEVVEVSVRSKVDINNRLYLEVAGKHSDGTVVEDVLLGTVDPAKGTVSLTSLQGKVKEVKFDAFVSSEAHTKATNVSFEIERRDITIGTGEHIEASLPLEMLQDTMALYNIDGASEVVDIMSNVVSTKLDQEIMNFLDDSFDANPTYKGAFDVHPAPQFAGNPKQWLEEIKRVIDFHATKLKSETYYHNGYFVIVGNPLDVDLIPNVSWTFNRVADAQNGIDVEYSIGAVSGANRYTIISSDLIPQGELTMFYVPTTNKFLTYKYYPYTFNVVNNYLNTQNQAIPGVMMTKRHTLEEFLPFIVKIEIKNNDGSLVRA